MAKRIDARQLMKQYIGRTISTVNGASNTILKTENDSVIVATKNSPNGEPVPIDDVQLAIERLVAKGNWPLRDPSRRSKRYRGSFYLAVLLSLPGVEPKRNPTRAVVTNRKTLERYL